MDNYNIKLHATHSQVSMRLAEIRFDLRYTIRQVKVTFLIHSFSLITIFITLGSLREKIWIKRGFHGTRIAGQIRAAHLPDVR